MNEPIDSGVPPLHKGRQGSAGTGPTASKRMTWAIIVVVFLGTVFAALCVMLFWSRRAEIRAALKEHRVERRIPADIPLELSEPDEPFVEKAPAENVSRHGARVLTKTRWQRNERVLVSLPQEVERSRARIAYCDPLPEQSFAVGLQFSSAVSEMSFGLQPHPFRK